ncbi:hypothetical protein [Paenibacillus radicis (ex Xue et al. 2023)]|uniref:Lipoprotein n=1 Tax=Paenibacillus radicis (ex Xue et al. 2023) TaxID=2972489 RepID=A0ABT1YRJ5_9BACL|nr:hypothetical protein [Paenibacillus radicis (ex Xue et al. 2023)]MCR8635791.1 hypothetical protein [Paenibacillus radicis (ex Xue et al. 2023)]
MKWISLFVGLGILLSACGNKGSEQQVHTFSEAIPLVQPQKSASASPVVTEDKKPAAEKPELKKAEPAASVDAPVIPVLNNSVTSPPVDPPKEQEQVKVKQTDQPVKQPEQPVKQAIETAAAVKVEPQVDTAAEEKKNTEKEKQEAAPAKKPAASANQSEIKWAEFFDNDKQTTPSDKFWDLSGKQVEIKGYMGEVLSMEKNWFLLIPQPGAECPFDNGDETYWNQIMIVYLPKGDKLRFTTGPLKITGRLDVGIKVDESGYKTMFRMYDAKFEKIKE